MDGLALWTVDIREPHAEEVKEAQNGSQDRSSF